MKLFYEYLFVILSSIKNSITILLILGLMASNILLITNAAFHNMAAGILDRSPLQGLLNQQSPSKRLSVLEAEKNARMNKLKKARGVARKIATRTVRNIGVNVTSMAGEAIPYLGIGLILTTTAMDINDGCDTVSDVNSILAELEDTQAPEDTSKICGMTVPTIEELTESIKDKIGGTLHQSVDNINDSGKNLYDSLGGTVYYSKEAIQTDARKVYDAMGGMLHELLH